MAAASTNWKLTLAYDGSGFHGWQIQSAQSTGVPGELVRPGGSGLRTIQGTLADSLLRLTGEQILPQGSGRTDAGVHALAQVVSFRLAAPIPAANLQRALNRILPTSIRVLSCEAVPHSFHARHSARSKTYEYRIFERRPERRIRPTPGQPAIERICSPFLAPYAWDCRWPLSLDLMQRAAELLIGTHDFTSMAATDPERCLRDPEQDRVQRDADDDSPPTRATKINPIKTITHAEWSRVSTTASPIPYSLFPVPSLLIFRIAGTGFLHHMVRNIVGTLVEIGRGSLEPADLTRILEARNRTAAGPTAPARGLYLVEVVYDHHTIDTQASPIQDDAPGSPASSLAGVVDVGMSGMNNAHDHAGAAR